MARKVISLRPYQQRAIDDLMLYFRQHDGHPLIAMPTGTGKSRIIARICEIAAGFPDQRVLMLTHVRELIAQNAAELAEVAPATFSNLGIVSAGLSRFEYDRKIVFGGIGTVYRRLDKIGRFDLVIVDEAHLINDESQTMYKKTFDALTAANPAIRIIGLTATPYRLGYGLLTDGKLFDAVASDWCSMEKFNDMIKAGFLAPLVPKSPEKDADLAGIRTIAGDFARDDLSAAMIKINLAACDEIRRYGKDRKKWLIFCAGIEHAESVHTLLCFDGIDAEIVHSKMSTEERDRAINAFKNGTARAIVNASVLTTGFNCPQIDLIAVLRPTQSPGLWVQMLGRGTRPNPGKVNCLVLDFGRNTERLGPINDVQPPRRAKKSDQKKPPPVKTCPSCRSILHAAARECLDCGFLFPISETQITKKASEKALIAEPARPSWFDVDSVTYHAHTAKSGRPVVLVMYHCGFHVFREWVCVGYDGVAGRKAQEWLRMRTQTPIQTTEQALAASKQFLKTDKIEVIQPPKKWPEILGYDFNGRRFKR